MKKLAFIILFMFGVLGGKIYAQITAPSSSTSFSTNYTSGFLSSGGSNDLVYVFCTDQNNNNVGELYVSGAGCSVVWYYYDGFSYSELGQFNNTATGLTSGLYMAQVNCGGIINCYRAWVWVNQTLVDVAPIAPGCNSFTLSAQAEVLDNEFLINDPPGFDFEIDADTYIQVCFWANHTYVSDLGFYLKAPGNQLTEPNNNGVVALLPAASDWGVGSTFQSNLTIPWSVTGCSAALEGVPCNSGNGVEEFCFSTNYWIGGPALSTSNPAQVPCVCSMTTPLEGVWAPAETWSRVYGFMAGDPGWAVQIYDCEQIDYGSLTRARIVFSDLTNCGQTTFLYDSGEISSTINDNSCASSTASLFIVPPSDPAGSYTVTSAITNYSWYCTGSGFTGNQLSHQIVVGTGNYPVTTSDFVLTVTETINAPGSPECEAIASETFITLPSDATITPVGVVCADDIPFALHAVDGGGTWTTNAPAGSINGGVFYPLVAGGGVWTVGYSIGGPCPDQDEIEITVHETIQILNFSNNICDDVNENYFVSFDVVNDIGDPTDFRIDYGTGTLTSANSFSHSFPSQTSYSITVSDMYDCVQYVLTGYKDCGCLTYAGTLSSIVPIQLCVGECTDMLSHNDNDVLDGNDMLEFIIHDGGNPQTVLARNATGPVFCLNNISGGLTGHVYYIAAIAGNNVGAHVSTLDSCYSQSPSTPVIWSANPTAFITGEEKSVCGLSIDLTANEPLPGQIGTWTATNQFIPTGGDDYHDFDISIIKAPPYGDVIFTWTVVNNICSGSDNILVHFNEQPNAYAGEDIEICGHEATLNAMLTLPASTGLWSGNGSFTSVSSPTSGVSGSGTQIYTWREQNGACWDDDYVTVNFVQEPQPTVTPGVDTVCGVVYNLNVINVTGTGSWSAYLDGQLFTPAPFYVGGNNIPNPQVIVAYGSNLSIGIDFVWTETINHGTLVCTNSATKRVVFSRQPIASVGPIDQAEICGNCYEFNADTTGSGWASGFWISKDIILESFDDLTKPNANICIDRFGSYGDTAYVDVEFLWVMTNAGCTSIDTMWVSFYQRPVANAGLDDAICGNNYELGAVFDVAETSGYTPSGVWSTYNAPSGQSANIAYQYQDTTQVTVSQVGIWNFIFRENNSLLTSCYSTDTVQIEFVERPVISAGVDRDICGGCTDLNGTTGGFGGSWLPNGASIDDFSDPHSHVCVNNYGARTFTWLESNTATTTSLSCSSQDEVIITFWRVPTAEILTDDADSTVCGLTFYNLRAENPGTGISGYWYSTNPAADFIPNEFTVSADVTMPSYGYHDYYWIEETGPGLTPGFCNDTAGPLTIRFIEVPTANAGNDTLFCGFCGNLNAVPSVGNGVWSTPSLGNITFSNGALHNTQVCSTVLNADNPTDPFFRLIWTEDNSNNCTDKDTMLVKFARIPSSAMQIIPPKCFGEPATINAAEDTLQQYTWNFYSGLIDSTSPANLQGGFPEHFIFWNNNALEHRVSLMTTNHWGCQSPINIDTIVEPLVPEFDITIVKDTCALGKGGIVFNDTSVSNAFFWINPNVGPPVNTPVTTVYNLPAGEYGIRTSYITPNYLHYAYYITTFGTPYCLDTIYYDIETIGMIQAEISVSAEVLLETLVAPNASVIFLNTSDYDDISKRCEWHFDDESILKSCDEMVEHIYAEAGCYNPFLIVMNRDLPECRDTAYLEACVFIDNASKLEIPNVFSPNADGINDFFQVKAQTLRTFSGMIVNRWGRTVYEWTNWEDYEAGWDGKLSGGTEASPGVYFYIIKAEGLDETPYDAHGALHLMRE